GQTGDAALQKKSSPNRSLQQTAAAILIPRSTLSPSAAAAAELGRSAAKGGGHAHGDGSWDYAMDSAPVRLPQGILARPAQLSASGTREVRRCVPFAHRSVARPLPLPPGPRSACALRAPEKLSARLALSAAAEPAGKWPGRQRRGSLA